MSQGPLVLGSSYPPVAQGATSSRVHQSQCAFVSGRQVCRVFFFKPVNKKLLPHSLSASTILRSLSRIYCFHYLYFSIFFGKGRQKGPRTSGPQDLWTQGLVEFAEVGQHQDQWTLVLKNPSTRRPKYTLTLGLMDPRTAGPKDQWVIPVLLHAYRYKTE